MRRWNFVGVWAFLGLVGLVGLVASVGCGLSTNDTPEALSKENLSEDVGGAPETSTPMPGGVDQEPVQLWFRETTLDVLQPIQGDVPQNATPGTVLETLFDFPNDELGRLHQMKTEIPPATRATSEPEIDDGVLYLELPQSFYDDLVDVARYAYGQIVLTMADNFDDILAVQFMAEGEPAPVADGESTEHEDGLVEPLDYSTLRTSDSS